MAGFRGLCFFLYETNLKHLLFTICPTYNFFLPVFGYSGGIRGTYETNSIYHKDTESQSCTK